MIQAVTGRRFYAVAGGRSVGYSVTQLNADRAIPRRCQLLT